MNCVIENQLATGSLQLQLTTRNSRIIMFQYHMYGETGLLADEHFVGDGILEKCMQTQCDADSRAKAKSIIIVICVIVNIGSGVHL